MIKFKLNPHLERLLAVLSLVIIILNFIVCLIVTEVRKNEIIKDGVLEKVVSKNIVDSITSKR